MSKNHNNNGGNNNQQRGGDNPPGYWIGFFAKIVLAIAMLLYLGLHSYNFFTFTFKGDQWFYAILGLFTTSIGFLLWLAIYLYIARDGLQKAIAIIMIFVSLGGEFAVAAFDMYMNISGQLSTKTWSAEELRNMSYVIAGLALANGLALVIDLAGKQIFDDLSNVKSNRNEQPQQQFQPPPQRDETINVTPVITPVAPVTLNPAEAEKVTLNKVPAPATGGGATKTPFPVNGQKR